MIAWHWLPNRRNLSRAPNVLGWIFEIDTPLAVDMLVMSPGMRRQRSDSRGWRCVRDARTDMAVEPNTTDEV
jgi:hypothetical protein